MRISRTQRFVEDSMKLPSRIRKVLPRKLAYLAQDLAHPSLRVKRVQRYDGVYEASINMDYRLLFSVQDDVCMLLRIGRHDVIDRL